MMPLAWIYMEVCVSASDFCMVEIHICCSGNFCLWSHPRQEYGPQKFPLMWPLSFKKFPSPVLVDLSIVSETLVLSSRGAIGFHSCVSLERFSILLCSYSKDVGCTVWHSSLLCCDAPITPCYVTLSEVPCKIASGKEAEGCRWKTSDVARLRRSPSPPWRPARAKIKLHLLINGWRVDTGKRQEVKAGM